MVLRLTLLNRLESNSVPVVCLRAPAGYGKSTALAQWADRDERPFVWIPVDHGYDDDL